MSVRSRPKKMAREIVLAARMGERVLAMTDRRDRIRRMVSRRRRDQFCESISQLSALI
jgi:hypothetical protein